MPKIITDIELMECTPIFNNCVRIVKNGNIENEDVPIKVYLNERNEKVYLGMSKDIQTYLGLPFNEYNRTKEYKDKFVRLNKFLEVSLNNQKLLVDITNELIIRLEKMTLKEKLRLLFENKFSDEFYICKSLIDKLKKAIKL